MLATRARGLQASEIRKALDASRDPRCISLAGGIPAPELFPVERFRDAFGRVLRDHPRTFLQYGPSDGHRPLREFVAGRLASTGTGCTPAQVLITSGSQQGIDLCARLLLDPGDRVVVERPSYVGAIDAFRQCQARFVTVASDQDGIRAESLEQLLRDDRGPSGPHSIKLLYLVPNFANPSGVTTGLARRRALVELAARFDLIILEDDPYGELRFDGEHLPSLAALDGLERVIRLGSFSKILSPGLRIGWVAGHPRFLGPLVHLKERSDLHSPIGAQMAVCDVASGGFLDGHTARLVDTYRRRRDAMVAAVHQHFPAEIAWQQPAGGFFLWCTAPEGTEADVVLRAALGQGVSFVPGREFHVDGSGGNTMRLNFSGADVDTIREGVRRLGTLLTLCTHWQQTRTGWAAPARAVAPRRAGS